MRFDISDQREPRAAVLSQKISGTRIINSWGYCIFVSRHKWLSFFFARASSLLPGSSLHAPLHLFFMLQMVTAEFNISKRCYWISSKLSLFFYFFFFLQIRIRFLQSNFNLAELSQVAEHFFFAQVWEPSGKPFFFPCNLRVGNTGTSTQCEQKKPFKRLCSISGVTLIFAISAWPYHRSATFHTILSDEIVQNVDVAFDRKRELVMNTNQVKLQRFHCKKKFKNLEDEKKVFEILNIVNILEQNIFLNILKLKNIRCKETELLHKCADIAVWRHACTELSPLHRVFDFGCLDRSILWRVTS